MLRLDELAPSGLAKAHSGVERRAVWAGWTTVPGDEEATRQLWSQRVAYFAAVFLALSAAFYLRNALAIAVLERAWPPLLAAPFLLHAAALGCAWRAVVRLPQW